MQNPLIKNLGIQAYLPVWEAMQLFTRARGPTTRDEIWLLEHPPVYTLGRNGKTEHLLCDTDIPLIKVDRGGQITYHGPGQLVVYLLLDLQRRKIGVRQLVTLIEDSIIALLADYAIKARGDRQAPGVYVENKKIAALGIRVSKGRTTHGLSLNIDADLTPFENINPCGYKELQVTSCKELGMHESMQKIAEQLLAYLLLKISEATLVL